MKKQMLAFLAVGALLVPACTSDEIVSTQPPIREPHHGAQIVYPWLDVVISGTTYLIKSAGDSIKRKCGGASGYVWRALGVNGSTTSSTAIATDVTTPQVHYGSGDNYGFALTANSGAVSGMGFRVDSVTTAGRFYSVTDCGFVTYSGIGGSNPLIDDSEGSVLIP
jgi:hypothetical protein